MRDASNPYRRQARGIVRDVLRITAGQDEEAVSRALSAACPWPEKAGAAYRAWLAEIQAQLIERNRMAQWRREVGR